jgi:hypothetical protein
MNDPREDRSVRDCHERAIFLAELAAGMATPEWKAWAVAYMAASPGKSGAGLPE